MTGRQGWQPTKLMPCRRCGRPVEVNAQAVNPPRCAECAIEVMAEAARQISGKSGPAYKAWLEAGGNRGRPKGRGRAFNYTPVTSRQENVEDGL